MSKEIIENGFFYRCILNISILYYVFKKQFFGKNKFLFIYFPILLSLIVVKYNLYIDIFSKDKISLIVTIISLIAWMLLNFLILILSDKWSILYTEWIKESYSILKWRFDDRGNPISVNYFEFIYNKIFFIIILSVIYVLIYIINDMGIMERVRESLYTIYSNEYFCENYPSYFSYWHYLIYWLYIYFIQFYFINVLYLIQKLITLLSPKYT